MSTSRAPPGNGTARTSASCPARTLRAPESPCSPRSSPKNRRANRAGTPIAPSYEAATRSRPSRWARTIAPSSPAVTRGWSQTRNRTASASGILASTASIAARTDEPMPVAQSGFSTTRAPAPAASPPRAPAPEPRTTSTGPQRASTAVAIACASKDRPRNRTSCLASPSRLEAPAARIATGIGAAGLASGVIMFEGPPNLGRAWVGSPPILAGPPAGVQGGRSR